jgi:hypothetical protein
MRTYGIDSKKYARFDENVRKSPEFQTPKSKNTKKRLFSRIKKVERRKNKIRLSLNNNTQ